MFDEHPEGELMWDAYQPIRVSLGEKKARERLEEAAARWRRGLPDEVGHLCQTREALGPDCPDGDLRWVLGDAVVAWLTKLENGQLATLRKLSNDQLVRLTD